MKVSIPKLKHALLLGFLFLAALNFRAKFFYFAFGALVIIAIFQKRLLISKTAIIYMLLGLLMALYNHTEGILSMLRCAAGLILYVVGYNIAAAEGIQANVIANIQSAEKRIYKALLMISAGSFVHFFLNFIMNSGSILGRNTKDIWTGETMAATGQAALACLMLGFSVSAVFLPPRKALFWIGIFCMLCILLYNLVLACRTIIIILLILLIVGICYKQRILSSINKKLSFWSKIIIVLAFITIIFLLDVGNIQKLLLNSNLGSRFNHSARFLLDNTARRNNKILYIENAFQHPFGGLHMQQRFGYAHDLLLDAYDEYGIGGLVLLLAVLFSGIKSLLKLIRKTTCEHELKLAILCIYIAILLEFCVEPVLTGMPWLFPCYCLINGCMSGLNLLWSKKREI